MVRILYLIMLICSVHAGAQESIKILFIGNSFTNGNSTVIDDVDAGTSSIPYKFKQLAETRGYNVDVEMYCPNGIYVYDYNQTGHANNSTTESVINSKQWDYVYIQDNQGSYVWSDGYLNATVGNANIDLYDKIKANNPCSRVIFYAGHALKGGLPSDYWNQGGLNLSSDNTVDCNARVYANVCYLNETAGFNEIVAPIGLVWNRYINAGYSENDLFHSDQTHPSSYGTYLGAAVIYSIVFRESPEQINWDGGLNEQKASFIREIAWDVVTDATIFNETHLTDYTPQISQNGNILSVENSYSSYTWYNDINIIQGATYYNYEIPVSGAYSVVVTDDNACKHYSMKINAYTTFYDFDIDNREYSIFGNMLTVKSAKYSSYKLYDISGSLIINGKIYKNETTTLTTPSSGIYFIKLSGSNNEISQKVYLK